MISPDALSCSALLPDDWFAGVTPADLPEDRKLPDGHDDAKPWQQGFLSQTALLETANERYIAGVGIIKRCEERNAKALRPRGLF